LVPSVALNARVVVCPANADRFALVVNQAPFVLTLLSVASVAPPAVTVSLSNAVVPVS
jgi:hypothetical protein